MSPTKRGDEMLEKIIIAVAWRLPRRLVYWCAIRVGAHATQGRYGAQIVPDLKFMDALSRWPLKASQNARSAEIVRS